MKASFPLACCAVCVLLIASGCAPHYTITLTNQRLITTHGKPKVNKEKGYVTFTDAEGTKRIIPLHTVRSIEPK